MNFAAYEPPNQGAGQMTLRTNIAQHASDSDNDNAGLQYQAVGRRRIAMVPPTRTLQNAFDAADPRTWAHHISDERSRFLTQLRVEADLHTNPHTHQRSTLTHYRMHALWEQWTDAARECGGDAFCALGAAILQELQMEVVARDDRGADLATMRRQLDATRVNSSGVQLLAASHRLPAGQARSRSGGSNGSRNGGRKKTKCFYCGKFGHVQANCFKMREDGGGRGGGGGGGGGGRGGYGQGNGRGGASNATGSQVAGLLAPAQPRL